MSLDGRLVPLMVGEVFRCEIMAVRPQVHQRRPTNFSPFAQCYLCSTRQWSWLYEHPANISQPMIHALRTRSTTLTPSVIPAGSQRALQTSAHFAVAVGQLGSSGRISDGVIAIVSSHCCLTILASGCPRVNRGSSPPSFLPSAHRRFHFHVAASSQEMPYKQEPSCPVL